MDIFYIFSITFDCVDLFFFLSLSSCFCIVAPYIISTISSAISILFMISFTSIIPLKIPRIGLILNEALNKQYFQNGALKHISLLLPSFSFKCKNPDVASFVLNTI